MTLEVLDPGMSATVQDTGRLGYRQYGLAVGGAADWSAFQWANKLLDNPMDAACLEIVMGGFRAVAAGAVTIALAGADAPIRVNGRIQENWATIRLKSGDELVIGMSQAGRLMYLAVPGGLDALVLFGSRSVVTREKLPGSCRLASGDRLDCLAPDSSVAPRSVPALHRPDYGRSETSLRLLPAWQYADFSQSDLVRLTTSSYQVTQQSDRMGFRLSGPPLQQLPAQILSEGVAVGAMQIPGDGQPIILMPDCQTIGGYPKPGTLPRADRARLAQLLPGQFVRFSFASLEEIQAERMVAERFFRQTCWTGSGELIWT